jgi:hypothetical protein
MCALELAVNESRHEQAGRSARADRGSVVEPLRDGQHHDPIGLVTRVEQKQMAADILTGFSVERFVYFAQFPRALRTRTS